ncbi:NmrA/HSCARG family protein [Kitasatospora sp. NPDC004240]
MTDPSTPPDRRTVLVTGATGGQGGAVARSLLADGWTVRALVRDPDRPAARRLASLGAELTVGDLDHPGSLRTAVQGVAGVFSVLPDLAGDHPSVEIRRGRAIADAAAEAAVSHLVHSSVGGAERSTGIAHFETKATIEAHLDTLGLPMTVLRPVFFMENWPHLLPEPAGHRRTAAIPLDADTPLQMIALADIGRIAAEAFANPAGYIGSATEIAGDELTVREIAATFTRVDGVPTRFTRRPTAELRSEAEEMAAMFDWLNTHGYRADLPALRDRHPWLLTLESWLRRRRRQGRPMRETGALPSAGRR